ncbi:MAG: glycosyltransferase family 39 protein [bacterium]|jgi:hypothetical protein
MDKSIGGRRLLLILVILSVFVISCVISIRGKSLTRDEPVHLRYGLRMLEGDSDRFIDGTMPVSALNAIPRALAGNRWFKSLASPLADARRGRLVTIVFSAIVAVYVFRWARGLYGFKAGLLSMALYALSPNIVAHSRLITNDIYGAGMAVIALYYFWRLVNHGGRGTAVAGALTLALCQLTKYVCLFLYPAYLAILSVRYLGHRMNPIPQFRMSEAVGGGTRPAGGRAFAGYLLLFIAVSLLVINAGYLFNRTMTKMEAYEWRSAAFTNLQSRLGPLGGARVPLPYPVLEGLDWGQRRVEPGGGAPNVYLLGSVRESGGFKGYYIIAFALKVPLAIQVMILLAAVNYVARRRSYRFFDDEVFVIVPVLLYAIYFNLFFTMQIGIRHFLVVFPLLFVFCGSLLKDRPRYDPRLIITVAGLMAYLVISVASYFPHYISYFNEIVWDRKMAYKLLADSNIEWGQNQPLLAEYQREHPDAFVVEQWKRLRRGGREEAPPAAPDSGTIVVDVNNLVGTRDPERFRWLRENYEPVGHIAYSYLVFEVGTKRRDDGPGGSAEE